MATVSQALRRVKKLKGLIAEATERANLAVSYNKEKPPAFSFKYSMEELERYSSELVDLEASVAVANANNTVSHNGSLITLAKAIRVLQELKGKISFLKKLHLRNEVVKDKEHDWNDDLCKNVVRTIETEFVSDLSEVDRDKLVKSFQDQFDELNSLVEDVNHKTNL